MQACPSQRRGRTSTMVKIRKEKRKAHLKKKFVTPLYVLCFYLIDAFPSKLVLFFFLGNCQFFLSISPQASCENFPSKRIWTSIASPSWRERAGFSPVAASISAMHPAGSAMPNSSINLVELKQGLVIFNCWHSPVRWRMKILKSWWSDICAFHTHCRGVHGCFFVCVCVCVYVCSRNYLAKPRNAARLH